MKRKVSLILVLILILSNITIFATSGDSSPIYSVDALYNYVDVQYDNYMVFTKKDELHIVASYEPLKISSPHTNENSVYITPQGLSVIYIANGLDWTHYYSSNSTGGLLHSYNRGSGDVLFETNFDLYETDGTLFFQAPVEGQEILTPEMKMSRVQISIVGLLLLVIISLIALLVSYRHQLKQLRTA